MVTIGFAPGLPTMAPLTTHPPRSTMPDWRRHLVGATTEHEIVNLTREYLATWGPDELSRLPSECRPGRIRDAEDISRWAYDLACAHTSLRYDDELDALLLRMLAFISEAAMRMAEVKAVEAAAANGA
jgi:hypothetical protein